MHFLFRTLITAGALMVVAYVVPGIVITGWIPAVVTAIFLIILNAIVRPVLVVLTLPITIVTLGLFLFIINAGILLAVASFVEGIEITSFGSALFGSVLLSLIGAFTHRKV